MTGKRPSNNPRKPKAEATPPRPPRAARPASRLPGIGDRADKAYRSDKNGQADGPKRAQARGPRRGAGLPAQQAAIREGTLGRPGAAARGRDAGPPGDWFEAPVAKTRKRAPKATVEVEVAQVEVVEVPVEAPVQPQRNVSRREAKGIRLDGKSEWTKKFAQAMKAHGRSAGDLVVVDPADVDELSDDDIFRTLMMELYITRKRKDDSVDTRPLQDALFNFDVRAVCDGRDEAATRLLPVVGGDRKKVHAMLQNVLRFVSIQERFRSFRNYLVEKVDRFENLAFDLEHRFVGLKQQQIQNLIDALGLTRRITAQEPMLKQLQQWGAVDDARPTADNWAKAKPVLHTIQTDVGCTMGALESMFLLFGSAPVAKTR